MSNAVALGWIRARCIRKKWSLATLCCRLMYMCIYTCVYIHVCIYVYIYVCMHKYVCIFMCVYIFVYVLCIHGRVVLRWNHQQRLAVVDWYMYVYIHMCVCTCMYVYIYICMNAYIYMRIYVCVYIGIPTIYIQVCCTRMKSSPATLCCRLI